MKHYQPLLPESLLAGKKSLMNKQYLPIYKNPTQEELEDTLKFSKNKDNWGGWAKDDVLGYGGEEGVIKYIVSNEMNIFVIPVYEFHEAIGDFLSEGEYEIARGIYYSKQNRLTGSAHKDLSEEERTKVKTLLKKTFYPIKHKTVRF